MFLETAKKGGTHFVPACAIFRYLVVRHFLVYMFFIPGYFTNKRTVITRVRIFVRFSVKLSHNEEAFCPQTQNRAEIRPALPEFM